MRKKFILIGFCIISSLVVIDGLFNQAKSYVSGAQAGYTGSPADGQSCITCHSPHENFSGSGLITSNIPAAGYTASQTYTIKAGITRLGHKVFGFEVSPQDTTSSGNLEGTIIITNSTTQLASGIQGYITHTISGTKATGDSISWSFNWTAPATGHGPVVFYGAFNASNDNGQSSGDSIFLTSLKVYECISPATPGSISGSSSVCSGTQTTYSVPAGAAGTTFDWSLPSGWTGTSTTNSITVTPGTSGGSISVLATNACGTSGSVSKTITVNSSSTESITIAPSQNDICAGTQVTFTAVATNGGASPVYEWQLNGQTVGSNSASYSSSALANGDEITCVLTSDLSCVLNSPETSNSVTMVVNPTVTPSVSISAPQLSICSDSTIAFTAMPANGGTTPAYQWYLNGSVINNATGSSYAPVSLSNNDIVKVQLTSNALCASPIQVNSSSDTIHLIPTVVPSVNVSSNSGASICKNATVIFSSTASNAGNSPTYKWQKNGIEIAGAVISSYSTDTLNNGDVISLILTSSASCASPQQVTSNTITMSVTSVSPTASISSNSGNSICAAQQVTFTSEITGGGTNPVYQWQNDGVNISGAIGTSYTTDSLKNGDVISLNLISNAACASPQSVLSDTIGISVVSNASPSVSIHSSFGDSLCAGQTGELTAIQINGGNSPNYQWFINGDSIPEATSSTYTPATVSNNDSFTVELVSNSSCVNSNIAFSSAFIITVIPNVTPTVTISLNGSDSICAGQTTVFTATVENAGANPGLQWLDNGIDIANQTGTSFSSATLTDSSSISVLLTSDLTCSTPPTLMSNDIIVYVSPVVQPAISFASSLGDTICQGQSVIFTASETNGGVNPSYQWIKNDTLIAGATSSSYTTSSINNGDALEVQLTSNASCALQTVVTSPTDTFTVPASFQSTVTISASNDSVCPGATIIFNADIQSFGGSYSSPEFYWEKNGNSVGNNTSSYIDTDATQGEVINCHCTSNSACLSDITSNNISITVFSTSLPVISNIDDTLISSPASSYEWFNNGHEINGATTQMYITDSAGSYSVLTTDLNGCQTLSDTFNFVPSGIIEQPALELFNIYPNPTDGLLNINFLNNEAEEKLNLTVYSIGGEVLLKQVIELPAGQARIQINLSSLSDGIYLLQINNKQLNVYQKFILSR